MKSTNNSKNKELRSLAEKKLQNVSQDYTGLTSELKDPKRLFHELQVHQIELELQNDELRKTQLELNDTLEKYFNFYNLAPLGFISITEKGIITEANLTASKLFGVDKIKLKGKFFSSFILKEDQDIYYLHQKKLFETDETQQFDLRIKGNGGSITWVNIQSIFSLVSENNTYCRLTITNISERKQAEEVANLNEKKYRELFNSMTEMFQVIELIYDNNGKAIDYYYRDVNPAFEKLVGKTRVQLIDKRVKEIFGIVEDYWLEIYEKVAKTGAPANFENYGAELDKWYEIYAWKPNDTEVAITFFDITERKKAEEVITASEHEFRLLTESMPQIVWTTTADGQNTYFNHLWVEYTGLTLEESYRAGWNKPFHPDDQQRAWEAWQNAVQYNAPYLLQCRLRRFDGVYRWWLIHGVPVIDNKGIISKWYGTCTDIDEMKNASEAILHNEQLLSAVIDNVSSGVALIDETGKFIVHNPVFLKLFGLSPDSTIKNVNDQDWSQWKVFDENKNILHVDDHPVRKAAMTGKLVKNQLVAMKLPSGGDYIWMMISAEPLKKEDGTIDKIICTYHDITERKRAEEELLESENFLRSTLDNMLEGCQIIDNEFRYSYMNAETERQLGRPKEELLGNIYYEMFPTIVENQIFSYINDCLINRTNKTFLNEFLYPDGRLGYYKINLKPIPEGVLILSEDITERDKAEKALKESEERFHTMADAMPQLAWIAKADGYIFWYNQRWYEYTGTTPEQMEGWGWQSVHDPELLPAVLELWKKSIATGEPFYMEFPLRGADGAYRSFLTRGFPLKNAEGQVIQWFGTNTDISEQKQTEDKLRESEARFRAIAETSPNAMSVTSLAGKFLYVNTAYESLFGYTSNELKTIPGTHVYWDINDRKDLLKVMKESGCVRNSELRLKGKNGEPFWALASSSSIIFDGEQAVLGTITDITALKQAEEQLKNYGETLKELNATKDKFFSIIAHDLRNPFTSLLGVSELMIENADKYNSERVLKFSTLINNSAKKVYALLENLLEWSRVQTGNIKIAPELINLCELVDGVISVLHTNAAEKEINLISEIEKGFLVNTDKNITNIIIRNLVSNAIKFTHSGGMVIVNAIKNENHVTVSVKDTGIGISNENIEKLFRIDEKITMAGTKNESGTGLGLILCNEFVENLGGRIWVESEIGKGSEFKFTLPVN